MADKLYFEPVFWEHLWDIIEHEKPDGVIVQLGDRQHSNWLKSCIKGHIHYRYFL
jgi:carbamoylphosphate synthase large subunit